MLIHWSRIRWLEEGRVTVTGLKFDSIKSRLLLMTLICVLGMGMLVASQYIFTQRLVTLNQQRDMLLRLGQDLLQMRRHEKDFLLRHQIDYFNRFNSRAAQFNNHLNKLTPLFNRFALPLEQSGELAEGLERYQQLFQKLVKLQLRIGLTPNDGLHAQLTETEKLLTERFNTGSVIYGQLMAARIAARDFMATRDKAYIQAFEQAVDSVRRQGNFPTQSMEARQLDQYEQHFLALSSGLIRMGVTHNTGLRGEFRSQAHAVEEQLNSIDVALQPLIHEQEQQVQLYAITIAGFTSVALILLLIKSFATFHRSFANFVMFFYRCKRQYQRIDTRQLGFAEFKSLAELANEMVESRRDIEAQLASAKARLGEAEAGSTHNIQDA